MGLEFGYPWALLLLPAAVALILWIDKRYLRRVRSLRSRVTLLARLILACVLTLALAAPSILLPGGSSVTWVLLDVSDSAAAARREMEERLKKELENIPEGEEVGIISFGQSAMVETPLSETPVFTGAHTAVSPDASRLTEALRLAGALMPSESAGRILVLSDGQTDDARAMAAGLENRGITVDGLEIESQQVQDAQVTGVSVPSEVFEGNAFSIQVAVDSNLSTQGTLVLYQNGVPGATREVALRKGENLFAFQDVADKTGVVTYEARLQATGDHQSKNNSASAYLYVAGAPNVLVVEGADGSGGELSKMLLAAGMKVERMHPEAMPAQADEFRQYDGIVLSNVDYDLAKEEQWQALETAVRVLGRGLTVIGGDSSYALGSYRGSTLETMLPVTIDVRDKLQMPALSLMLVIDKSGSMTAGQFGTTRLEVAKEAAMLSTEVLTAKDQVGVIAFDDAAKWVVPLQPVTDVGAIQSLIGTIRPGGGTAFYTALDLSVAALIEAKTPQKHIIFLSDGEPGDSGFEQLALLAMENGITLTTVAVGSGANIRLMELLSTLGGGRFYATGEFDNIPKIFTKETFLAGGTYVQNREFTPIVTEESTLTNFEGFPSLTGYLSTLEKPLATVSMMTDREDPLLSWWRYGAGTVTAWTSDAEGSWTGPFLAWENAAAFFGGIVAKTLPQEARDGDLQVKTQNGTAKISYQIAEGNGGTQGMEGLETLAIILYPDGTREQLPLTQTDVNTFEGSFSAEHQGAYAMRVEQRASGETLRVKEGGAVVSFAEEYDLRSDQAAGMLDALVTATGGRKLGAEDTFFTKQERSLGSRKELTMGFCVLALVLLLADIALRRISWEAAVLKWLGRREEQRVQKSAKPEPDAQPASGKKRGRTKAQPEKPTPVETADRLLEAKRQRKQL